MSDLRLHEPYKLQARQPCHQYVFLDRRRHSDCVYEVARRQELEQVVATVDVHKLQQEVTKIQASCEILAQTAQQESAARTAQSMAAQPVMNPQVEVWQQTETDQSRAAQVARTS